ncbi:uncharacterized protein EI90DRAFT_3280370 [Cantharellus anzutake]|uniref:uncharacterized protein n=1 Tax=Cantharellus anzutake TaxID=1750568 RepID=UPI001907EEEF|nr:uncharacterized protein EI90DRAFT_3280370 [Cantharellus anzutake]KAF8333415.1 hypothetical protein EI90DRAFT_3280370 [Cantharellus anzutake]
MTAPTHILFESSSGYALFSSRKHADVQNSIRDAFKFGKMVELRSFAPFKTAAHALENANDISEGIVNDYLKELLELNLLKSKSNEPIVLGVSDKNLASSLSATLGINCDTSPRSLELIRGIRLHAERLLRGLQAGDLAKAQLGLGHAYSRGKVKFNVHRADNMIIQAISLLDQLDKDVNTFHMRIREWYGYTFPELAKIVPDSLSYARAVRFIGSKSTLNESKLDDLTDILGGDATLAKNILDAARTSMGSDLNEIDAININHFAERTIGLAEYRHGLVVYLSEKMHAVAPSLSALLGERLGARLISHAGSLTNLSKYPASTVQILGAEKALFRALKTKGKTPKFGLLYHSPFISRAKANHKGRISRLLANKCSIASRIDCFSEKPTIKFGDALRQQVEERLQFYESGVPPSKNSDVMQQVLKEIGEDEESDTEMAEPEPPKVNGKGKKGKEKAEKKKKKRDSDGHERPEKKRGKEGSEKKDEESPVKKRKREEVEEENEPSPKKLSKDEKKAAKRAEKAAANAEPSPEKKKHKKDKDRERESKKRRKSETA